MPVLETPGDELATGTVVKIPLRQLAKSESQASWPTARVLEKSGDQLATGTVVALSLAGDKQVNWRGLPVLETKRDRLATGTVAKPQRYGTEIR